MTHAVPLDDLPIGTPAQIVAVDWNGLAADECLRLRSLGFEPGSQVSVAYRGVFGGHDPIAIRIGRMTVALRRNHARVMKVEPLA